MINFTNCKEELNNYKGSEKKKTLIYDGKKYLVKFPDPIREKNKNISYINNAFSEYIGSNIFKMVGFPTQNTIIGVYKYNEKEKIVCACEDFTNSNKVLYEFENLALSTNPDKKIETELTDILNVLDENNIINIPKIREKFWDMFVIDSLIGNTDRHNGNWGFLVDIKTNKIEFAPIYDCGSCLNPMIDDDEIKKLQDNDIKNLAINCYSCLKENSKKINYMTYIKECKNEECNKAILRVFKNIKIDEINKQYEEVNQQILELAQQGLDTTYIGGELAWPVPGYTRITSKYAMRVHPITGQYKLHTGVDIGAPMGANFVAANDGVVVKAGPNTAYGNMVIIDHGGGISTLYAHGSEILVEVGQTVKRGDAILKVGSTGYSTGPHAHFEVRINGVTTDPLPYITNGVVPGQSNTEENSNIVDNANTTN